MSRWRAGQIQNTLEMEIGEEREKVDESILHERKKARSKFDALKKTAKEAILKLEADSKAQLAGEEERIERLRTDAMDRLSEKRKELDERLRRFKIELEEDWEKQKKSEMEQILEEERKVAKQKMQAKDATKMEKKAIGEYMMLDIKEAQEGFQTVERGLRSEGQKKVEDAVKRWFEEEKRSKEGSMLTQLEAEGFRRQREQEQWERGKRDESERQTAERRKQKELAEERRRTGIIKARTKYESRWRKIKEANETPSYFSDMPWPTLQAPTHALDIPIDAIREFLLSPDYSTQASAESRLRSELERWRSDALVDVLSRVVEEDKTKVELGANLVRILLNELLLLEVPSMDIDAAGSLYDDATA